VVGVLILIAAALGQGRARPEVRRLGGVGLGKSSIRTGVIQQQSPHDDVSGPYPGLHIRTGHGEHVVEGRADGVRDVGGEFVLHAVDDADDRYSQTIHASEGDQHNDVINLVLKLGNVAVPPEQVEARPNVFADNVELAMRENNGMGRESRDAG
jgi:hypothetical protein